MRPVAFLVFLLLIIPRPVLAQETPTDWQPEYARQQQQIEELEQKLQNQQETIQVLTDRISRNSSQSARIPANRFDDFETNGASIDFLEALSEVSRRTVNGRIHIDQWFHPENSEGIHILESGDPTVDPDNELLYRRIRLGVKGTVPPRNMSYRLEIEFSGQDGSQFRDAWIGWDDLLILQTVRLGNQKRPYGWDHLNSSNFMVFLERPFVVEAFNQDNRRFGVASYGVTDDKSASWQYGVFYLPRVQDIGSVQTERIQPEFAGRFAKTLWYDDATDGQNYAHIGLSGTWAFPDGDAPNTNMRNNEARFRTRPEGRSESFWLNTGRIAGAESYEILGTEAVLNLGPFQLAGEWMHLWLQRESSFGSDVSFHGGYIYASYFLTGESIPWNRELGTIGRVKPHQNFFPVTMRDSQGQRGLGAWQIAARLSYADLSDEDVLGGDGQNATIALNWYWNAHSRLQANYIFGRIDDRLAALNQGGNRVVSGDYQIAGLRWMLDF